MPVMVSIRDLADLRPPADLLWRELQDEGVAHQVGLAGGTTIAESDPVVRRTGFGIIEALTQSATHLGLRPFHPSMR